MCSLPGSKQMQTPGVWAWNSPSCWFTEYSACFTAWYCCQIEGWLFRPIFWILTGWLMIWFSKSYQAAFSLAIGEYKAVLCVFWFCFLLINDQAFCHSHLKLNKAWTATPPASSTSSQWWKEGNSCATPDLYSSHSLHGQVCTWPLRR